ncbi:hypothetical protein K432DRAFT_377598 [Lepidopterella palustris CBS 459.81]|uniref:Uncharacterized protein n=1 Tax=Lepidopterella palustris CBS 459.81 TaxID=1314670 RepID=A0A8E2JJZ5_9PEZI|nr:hypothetical protein K432DRAFT_377598 [Lepidopterella palustris CBS 459.81]
MSRIYNLFLCVFALATAAYASDMPSVTEDYITMWTDQDPHWLAEFGLFGLGTGGNLEPRCTAAINMTMNATPQYVQMAMAMSTTLMSLLPTLLTIGNLYAASSSEVFSTSLLVGLSTAAMSFGLPVKTKSGIHPVQKMNLSKLPGRSLFRLKELGQNRVSKQETTTFLNRLLLFVGLRQPINAFGADDAYHTVPFAELNAWNSGAYDSDNVEFQRLRLAIETFRNRSTLWGAPRNIWWIFPYIIFLAHVGILLAISLPNLFYYLSGWPIYDCTTQGQTWWVLASTVVSMAFKFLSWELGHHELVRIHLLQGTTAIRHISHIQTVQNVVNGLPPLRPYNLNPFKIATQFLRSALAHLQFLYRNRRDIRSWSPARRKPFTVLIHLTSEARSPFPMMFAGFLEGLILLSLTFFFGTFWGGNLMYTMIYLITTLTAVSLGRALGIVYVKWSEAANGFSVIECQDVMEVRGVLRVLAALNDDVMVEVNQAYYVQGRRIDRHPDFKKWLEDCERGDYDVVKVAKEMAKEMAREEGNTVSEGATPLLSQEVDGAGEAVHLAEWRRSTQSEIDDAAEKHANGMESGEEGQRPWKGATLAEAKPADLHSPLDP